MILVLKNGGFYFSLLFVELHFLFFWGVGGKLQEKDGRDSSCVLPSAIDLILNDEFIVPFNTMLVFPSGFHVSV